MAKCPTCGVTTSEKLLTYKETSDGDTFEVIKGNGKMAMLYDDDTERYIRTVHKGTVITIRKQENKDSHGGTRRHIYYEIGKDHCWSVWGTFRKYVKKVKEA